MNGRPETMQMHLLECSFAPTAVKVEMGNNEKRRAHRPSAGGLASGTLSSTATEGPMDSFLTSKPLSAARNKQLREELPRVIFMCNLVFNCVQSPYLIAFLNMWIPVLPRVPTRWGMSGNVLEDVNQQVYAAVTEVYKKGVFVVMTIDSWNSRAGAGLLRVLLHSTHHTDARIKMDRRCTMDVTGVAETGQVVLDVLRKTIGDDNSEGLLSVSGAADVDFEQSSTVVGVVSDSASPKVSAKKQPQSEHRSIIIAPCIADRLTCSWESSSSTPP